MSNTDWGKQSAIAGYLGVLVAAIGIGVTLWLGLRSTRSVPAHTGQSGAVMSPVIWVAASLYLVGVIIAGCLHYKAAKLKSVHATGPFSKTMLDQWTAAGSRLDESINYSFKYQEVRIDGRKFIGCSFTHVNLFYDGTLPFHFDNCQFDSDTITHFHTNNPAMAQWTVTCPRKTRPGKTGVLS
jgi:hypothetical protein